MKVDWTPRAKRDHERGQRIKRVQARLTSTAYGDIPLGIPVVTDRQLRDLAALSNRLHAVAAEIDEKLELLNDALDCLRGANHPEGWASVQVVEAADQVLVANVRHHKGGRR